MGLLEVRGNGKDAKEKECKSLLLTLQNHLAPYEKPRHIYPKTAAV